MSGGAAARRPTISFDFPSWQYCAASECQNNQHHGMQDAPPPATLAELMDDLDDLDDSEPVSSATGDANHSAGSDVAPPRQRDDGVALPVAWHEDVMYAVLSLLRCGELCAARLVSRHWLAAASGDALWRSCWLANEHFARRMPRRPCGAAAFGAPAPPFPFFAHYVSRCRAAHLYSWLDLQLGWERLEALLAPGRLDAHSMPTSSSRLPWCPPCGRESPSAWDGGNDVGGGDVVSSDVGDEGGGSGGEASASTVDHSGPCGKACREVRAAHGGDSDGEDDGRGSTRLAPRRANATLSHGAEQQQAPLSARQQARKLASILATRDWDRLHRCVVFLQLECAEQLAASLLPVLGPPGLLAEPSALAALPSSSNTAQQLLCEGQDEALLVRVLEGWRAFSRWLGGVCGCFAHQSGTSCSGHLLCLLAAQRSRERLDQHTPSLLHAGFGAFRQAVLLSPPIGAALQRHLKRATGSVMAQGGYTAESGRLMQQLIDLHELIDLHADVRDDHLCEERGGRFSQQALQDALLTPLRQFWQMHSRSWFCGVRCEGTGVLEVYHGSGAKRRRQQERRAVVAIMEGDDGRC